MRRKKKYFNRDINAPEPISVEVVRRVSFSEIDLMAIAWHGRYAVFFEEASAKLGRKSGMSYKAFRENNLLAPIAQLHVDYHRPLELDELFKVKASMIWNDAAKINIEYLITKENGLLACTGYTVQLFVSPETSEVCWTIPPLFDNCRKKWLNGEFV